MAKIINAIFEDGVFKPLEEIDIKEHEKVMIRIVKTDDWQHRFDEIIKKIHSKTAQYSYDEIEADISQAVREVRQEKGSDKSCY
ncbi:MAG TPA: antitoxin family protein [Syntrophorhabdaceae bacterium]|jgi:predicted DNA-binding antitoxin AbrB/MazE fold protein|nr:antitoxin family protein [Syntrophorhabdaceae bacterium]MBV6504934.1 hypothetical protein [Syntrophorhabdaceae bacterium]HOG39570.1 antitoxin family protein [Syntrophorhabdaceae bacterium]HQI57195.1 antitoxin family protein [Syntrophorhabdaceae bacterium]HQJ94698.1 antitoxin family protein [Syntrophorhabdaceae bacterium]